MTSSFDRVRSALAGTRFTAVGHVEQTGSTNDDLVAAARAGAPEGTALVADHQRGGRGRLDRRWEAPAGAALLASVLLRPAVDPTSAHWTVSMAAVALARACESVADVRAGIKWPNDLVIDEDGRSLKLAGVLADSLIESGRLDAVVVGVGCNLSWSPPDLAATSLLAASGGHVDRDELLVAYLRELDAQYSGLLGAGGFEALRRDYTERCSTIGQRVRAEVGADVVAGTATRIARTGHLVVATAAGEVEVVAGDVIHVRPDDLPRR